MRGSKQEGLSNLQIFSDFDQTITAFKGYCGKTAQHATFGILRLSDEFSEDCREELLRLFNKYHPIETDTKISQAEKEGFIGEWNDGLAAAYLKEGVTSGNMLRSLNKSNLSLRHNFSDFFRAAAYANLPFYVISGGVTPMLKTVLDSVVDVDSYDNLFLTGNDARFNEQTSHLEQMVMNVNSSKKQDILNRELFEIKKNGILLGDSPHDILMASQLECDNLISILFIRDNVEKEQFEKLQGIWDIIIRFDGSYILPHAILHSIAGPAVPFEVQLKGDAKESWLSSEVYSEARQLISLL